MTTQKKIIVIGSGTDCVVQAFARQMPEAYRQDFYFIDQELFGDSIHLDDQKWYFASGREIKHKEVTGVWNRLLDIRCSGNNKKQTIEQYACYLMDEVYPQVLNKPKYAMSNYAKQYQTELIQTQNVQKIDGYICANAQLSLAVVQQSLIRKSMSSMRSVVEEVSLINKSKYVRDPVLFQSCIRGVNIRVHVIGQEVIACQCSSSIIDYRYDKNVHMKKVKLPEWLQEECRQITRQLELIFAGIDLIYTKNKYYLLEVNTAPGYTFFDLDHKISYAVINNLRRQHADINVKIKKRKQDRSKIN